MFRLLRRLDVLGMIPLLVAAVGAVRMFHGVEQAIRLDAANHL